MKVLLLCITFCQAAILQAQNCPTKYDFYLTRKIDSDSYLLLDSIGSIRIMDSIDCKNLVAQYHDFIARNSVLNFNEIVLCSSGHSEQIHFILDSTATRINSFLVAEHDKTSCTRTLDDSVFSFKGIVQIGRQMSQVQKHLNFGFLKDWKPAYVNGHQFYLFEHRASIPDNPNQEIYPDLQTLIVTDESQRIVSFGSGRGQPGFNIQVMVALLLD